MTIIVCIKDKDVEYLAVQIDIRENVHIVVLLLDDVSSFWITPRYWILTVVQPRLFCREFSSQHGDLDHHQNLITCSFYHLAPFHKIS